MPANSRWDLIRRLRVKQSDYNKFSQSTTVYKTFHPCGAFKQLELQ